MKAEKTEKTKEEEVQAEKTEKTTRGKVGRYEIPRRNIEKHDLNSRTPQQNTNDAMGML